MNFDKLARIEVLLKQDRAKDAEKMLADLLAAEPNNTIYLGLMGEALLSQNKIEKALQVTNNAIGLSPNDDSLFYLKARIAIQQEEFSNAEQLIKKAIAIDPEDADYHALLAFLELERKEFNQALNTANRALALDSENLFALNTRSTALIKLKRKDESFETIEGALREDPNNAYTHTNYGWNLLEQGNHEKALNHFKEALQNDPSFEYAKGGMQEAIKASNPIYRGYLKYAFWIQNLTSKYRWAFIIGIYLMPKVLRTISVAVPALAPILIPLSVVVVLLAFSTWVIEPISNLFLRFNKFGQFLLTKNEKMSSNFVAISFGVFLIGLLGIFTTKNKLFFPIAIYGFTMMAPLGIVLKKSINNIIPIYTISLAIVGIIAITQTYLQKDVMHFFSIVYLLGFFAFGWIVNIINNQQ